MVVRLAEVNGATPFSPQRGPRVRAEQTTMSKHTVTAGELNQELLDLHGDDPKTKPEGEEGDAKEEGEDEDEEGEDEEGEDDEDEEGEDDEDDEEADDSDVKKEDEKAE